MLIAQLIVGEGKTGPPSANSPRSFQLSLFELLGTDEVVRLRTAPSPAAHFSSRPLALQVVVTASRATALF